MNRKNRCAVRGAENRGLGLQLESSLLYLWVMGGADDAVLIHLCLPWWQQEWCAEASFMGVSCMFLSDEGFYQAHAAPGKDLIALSREPA